MVRKRGRKNRSISFQQSWIVLDIEAKQKIYKKGYLFSLPFRINISRACLLYAQDCVLMTCAYVVQSYLLLVKEQKLSPMVWNIGDNLGHIEIRFLCLKYHNFIFIYEKRHIEPGANQVQSVLLFPVHTVYEL